MCGKKMKKVSIDVLNWDLSYLKRIDTKYDELLSTEYKKSIFRMKKILEKTIEKNCTLKQKEYIEMYLYQKKSIPEIAKIKGLTTSTVSITINRGFKRAERVINSIPKEYLLL
ncbi:hypothetical protein FACS1894132_06570 [Clostridia bacterium]|nr:hypothetical protein FACS1894132_06570 [Clostridia bacterium]